MRKAPYHTTQLTFRFAHTPGHIDCPACAEARTLVDDPLSSDLLFPDAYARWIAHRKIDGMPARVNAKYLAPKTIADYDACAVALAKFFGSLRLRQIHAGHLRAYQNARVVCDHSVADWKKPCNPNRVRKEISLLLQVLRDARCWGEEERRCYLPLQQVENDVPRAMNPEEQRRFLRVAASRTEWQFVYWYSVVALCTTASTNELRSLRLADINMEQGVMQVRREGAKNKYRIRTIPLATTDVIWCLGRLIERAHDLGSVAPHHCLFPFGRSKGHYDPTRPMTVSGLKKRWEAVRAAANMEWLRPYDLRHTAITRMAEAGTPIQVIMSFAGHMTLRMQQHYTAISMAAKRQWAQSSWGDLSAPPTFGPQADHCGGTLRRTA